MTLKARQPMQLLLALAAVCTLVQAPQAMAIEAMVLTEKIRSDQLPELVTRDFGSVPEGQPVVLQLAVENTGSKQLAIGAVKPLCGCMTADGVESIDPGTTGTISFRLETGGEGYAGKTTEAGLVQWVDATVPVTRIEMVLTVQPVLEVQPRMVRIRTTEGKGASQRVTISTHGGEAFAITKVTASKPFLQTSLSGEGASRQLTITLAADAPTGLQPESVTVHTDLEQVPTVTIKVIAAVKPASS